MKKKERKRGILLRQKKKKERVKTREGRKDEIERALLPFLTC